MNPLTLTEVLHIIYKSIDKPFPKILNNADELLPDAIDEDRDPMLLFDELLKDGWNVKRDGQSLKHETLLFAAAIHHGKIAAQLSFASHCNTPWRVRLGLFKPWSEYENARYRDGYLEAVGLDIPSPLGIDFGNGKPICLLSFSPYGTTAMVEYWQSELMDDSTQFPLGTHSEDQGSLLNILTQIGSNRINCLTDSAKMLLNAFRLPNKPTNKETP